MILIISYDLKGSAATHAPLFEAIKSNSDAWWHYLPGTWLVKSTHTPEQYFNFLEPHMKKDTGDRIMVTVMSMPYWGWMPKEAWDWIERSKG